MSDDDIILALGPVDTTLEQALTAYAPVITIGPDAAPEALLARSIGLIARGVSVVDRALIERSTRLKVIGRTGVGIDRVDLGAATERGIPVVITPDAGTRAVAEGTLALVLHLTKRLGRLDRLVRSGGWQTREQILPGDLDGATMGLVGYGRIGRRVAELARCFGATVLVTDPALEHATPDVGFRLVDLPQLVRLADVISLHAPLTAQTANLIDRAVLAQMKPTAILINCARGGLLDLDATYEALIGGRLAGVGLDVFATEPPVDHPLFHHPDVVLTPHVMGLSRRAWRATFDSLAADMGAVLSGRRITNLANPEIYHRGE